MEYYIQLNVVHNKFIEMNNTGEKHNFNFDNNIKAFVAFSFCISASMKHRLLQICNFPALASWVLAF